MPRHNNQCPNCDEKVRKAVIYEFKRDRKRQNTLRSIGWWCIKCQLLYSLNYFNLPKPRTVKELIEVQF